MNVGQHLGAGTFGVVFLARDSCDNDTLVALKKIKMERETQGFPVNAIREIRILKALKHPNVVDLREIVVFNENDDRETYKSVTDFQHNDVFMVFEYVDYDLYGLIRSSGVIFNEAHIRSYMKQLLDGVHFLHKNNILHRDIKSANILITKGNVLKIADWGLARFTQKSNHRLSNPVVTLWYRSPELLCGMRKYGPEVDMWSVGCIFGEMKARGPILAYKEKDSELLQMELLWSECGTNMTSDVLKKYEEYPNWDKYKFTKTSNKSIKTKFEGERGWDTDSLNLLESLLDWNPETRMSASDALSHSYFYNGQGVIPPNKLLVFDNVECPRQSDVMQKHNQDHEKRIEAKRKADIKQKDMDAVVAANKADMATKAVKRRFDSVSNAGGVSTGQEKKYKVIRRPGGATAKDAAKDTTNAVISNPSGNKREEPVSHTTNKSSEPAPQSLKVEPMKQRSLASDGFF